MSVEPELGLKWYFGVLRASEPVEPVTFDDIHRCRDVVCACMLRVAAACGGSGRQGRRTMHAAMGVWKMWQPVKMPGEAGQRVVPPGAGAMWEELVGGLGPTDESLEEAVAAAGREMVEAMNRAMFAVERWWGTPGIVARWADLIDRSMFYFDRLDPSRARPSS